MGDDRRVSPEAIPVLQVWPEPRSPLAASPEMPPPLASGSARGLWTLVVLLVVVLVIAGWWGQLQLDRLEKQLIATQDSFARVSERASGQLQQLSGQVSSHDASMSSGTEALLRRVVVLERQQADLERRLQLDEARQQVLTEQQAGLAVLAPQQEVQGEQLERYRRDLQQLGQQLEARWQPLEPLGRQVSSLAEQQQVLSALPGTVARLEQELLVVRSQLEVLSSGPAASGQTLSGEFDAFRRQTSRRLDSLQGQLRALQESRGR